MLSVLTLPSWARRGNGTCVGGRKRVLECTMASGSGPRGHMISRASHGAPATTPHPPLRRDRVGAHCRRRSRRRYSEATWQVRYIQHEQACDNGRWTYNLAGSEAVLGLPPESRAFAICTVERTASAVRFSYHHHIEYSFSASPTFSDNSLNSVCTRYLR